MTILNEVYQELKRNGFTHNHCDFSVAWLNISHRYMSMIRASGREPSIDALTRLACNLKQRNDLYQSRHVGAITRWLGPLTEKISTTLYNRCLGTNQSKK